jgi:hypothetical protein
VRYWINGEDEDYRREMERVSRVGGAPPAPLSLSSVAGMVLLVGIQVVLFATLLAILVLR